MSMPACQRKTTWVTPAIKTENTAFYWAGNSPILTTIFQSGRQESELLKINNQTATKPATLPTRLTMQRCAVYAISFSSGLFNICANSNDKAAVKPYTVFVPWKVPQNHTGPSFPNMPCATSWKGFLLHTGIKKPLVKFCNVNFHFAASSCSGYSRNRPISGIR